MNSTVHPAKEQEPHTISALGRKDRESLAERLATERINHLSFVTDPFEEWNKAREEILREIYEIEGDIPVKAIAV